MYANTPPHPRLSAKPGGVLPWQRGTAKASAASSGLGISARLSNTLTMVPHLLFGRPAVAHHRLFDLQRRVLGNRTAVLRRRQQADAAGLSNQKRIGDVAIEKAAPPPLPGVATLLSAGRYPCTG